jgi:protein associated with RNAse G/E
MSPSPLKKYELTLRTGVLRGEKANKPLDAKEAPNPNQSNRLIGYLGEKKVVVAQVPGKGGMDFNKLMGGKVFAVAADGFFPMFEKDENKKRTKVQKKEEGLDVYTSSGFYLLSSKEYPALDIREVFTMLRDKGEQVWIISEEQLAAKERQTLTSDFDLDMLIASLEAALSDSRNRLIPFDADANKRRRRGIERGKGEAEDAGEDYTGVEFEELKVSKKDGNPFVLFAWDDGTNKHRGAITRERDVNDDGKVIRQYMTAEEAIAYFKTTQDFRKLAQALADGKTVDFGFAQGDVMRTSVSFRRKCENVLAAPPEKNRYGDGVYILAAMKGWTRGIINVMFSQHPNFPAKDYDAHHYVAACRQAEIGMNKTGEGKWTAPEAVHYALAPTLLG